MCASPRSTCLCTFAVVRAKERIGKKDRGRLRGENEG